MTSPNFQQHKLIITFVILLFFPTHSFAQENNQNADKLIKLSDLAYGADDRLDFGIIYRPKNINTISHPFLISDDWKKGSIFINGIKFKDASLNYHILKDEVLYKGENPSVMVLTKSYIDSLFINQHLLINSDKLDVQNSMGFIELLNRGNYTTYLKHKIGITQVSSGNSISLKYMKPKFTVYIRHEDLLINLSSKRSFLFFFSSRKKDISKFMKKNKIKYKKATQLQLISLLEYCDNFPKNLEIE